MRVRMTRRTEWIQGNFLRDVGGERKEAERLRMDRTQRGWAWASLGILAVSAIAYSGVCTAGA